MAMTDFFITHDGTQISRKPPIVLTNEQKDAVEKAKRDAETQQLYRQNERVIAALKLIALPICFFIIIWQTSIVIHDYNYEPPFSEFTETQLKGELR